MKKIKKPKPNNPSLWSRAKSAAKKKFKVYPSAYANAWASNCLLYTSPSPRDRTRYRMPSSA